MRLLLVAPFLISLVPLTLASFCGESAIPFSVEVLPDGQPVLGCARPSCFGWNREGKPASSPPSFYRINKRADGYFRKATFENMPIKGSNGALADSYQPQVAKCGEPFARPSAQCAHPQQWVGGISASNVSNAPISLQCCSYEPLEFSGDRGIATVRPGQIVLGGEISNERGEHGERMEKRQFAFDYVSNIVKHAEGGAASTFYEVSIHRMPCVPPPKEATVPVDEAVFDEMIRRFTSASSQAKQGERNKAFQAPIQSFGPPPPPGPPPPQNPPSLPIQPPNDPQAEYRRRYYWWQQQQQQQTRYYYIPPQEELRWWCFSADSRVRTLDGLNKRMDELKEGDWVLSATNEKVVYSPVEYWLHRITDEPANFHRIELESGQVLKITSKHYLYKSAACSDESLGNIVPLRDINWKPVFAEEVRSGDCLYVVKENFDTVVGQPSAFVQQRVASVSMVREQGYYAPMTSTGDIVVDGVLASCYTIHHNPIMQHTYFSSLRKWTPTWVQGLFGAWDNASSLQKDLPIGIKFLTNYLAEHVIPAKDAMIAQ